MSVYRVRRTGRWTYDFWFQGRRYYPVTSLDSREDAAEALAIHKRTLRRRAAGLEALDASDTPRFSDWAAVTLKFQRERKRLKRPDAAKNSLRMILAFWGTRPRTKPVAGGEYRDLRLGDPIRRPELIGEFEAWMTARKLSGSRKNHYRSACSMLYRVALLPEHRSRAGVRENPFAGVLRDRVVRRSPVLEPDAISRWIDQASLPVVAAVTIGALVPGLRLRNVVELRWRDLTPARDFLAVPHKADRLTGRPLTLAVSRPLQAILAELRRLHPSDRYVVPLEGERYWQLLKLLKRSIVNAGLPYGRRHEAGVTFHALRHSMNTWLARQGVTADERQRAMGHETGAMQQWYTHFGGLDTVRAAELLGTLPVAARALERLQALPSPDEVTVTRLAAVDSPGVKRRKALKAG